MPREIIERLLAERQEAYAAADLTVDTSERSGRRGGGGDSRAARGGRAQRTMETVNVDLGSAVVPDLRRGGMFTRARRAPGRDRERTKGGGGDELDGRGVVLGSRARLARGGALRSAHRADPRRRGAQEPRLARLRLRQAHRRRRRPQRQRDRARRRRRRRPRRLRGRDLSARHPLRAGADHPARADRLLDRRQDRHQPRRRQEPDRRLQAAAVRPRGRRHAAHPAAPRAVGGPRRGDQVRRHPRRRLLPPARGPAAVGAAARTATLLVEIVRRSCS